jgi:two-component system NtrC family sensor kinase
MDVAKVQQALIDVKKNKGTFAGFWTKVASMRFRVQGLQSKLILPYLILTLIIAAIGVFIITTLVVDSERERFNNNLLEASRVANDGIVSYERNQLERLRFLVFTEGMAQAMFDTNADQILNILRPILANSRVNLISALDTNGKEIVTFGRETNANSYHRQEGADFSGLSAVSNVLTGDIDKQGDKFAQLIKLGQGPILFTSAPVKDANSKLVGVMLVGTYLDDILIDLKKQSLADNIILVDPKGDLIGSTLTGEEEGFDTLISITKKLTPEADTQLKSASLNRRAYVIAYSPLTIRNQRVGWIGVVKNSDYLISQAAQSRNLLIWVFTVGTFGFIIIGYILAQNIARPILKLRDMSQAVASGDLNQSIGLQRQDEIGELAQSFDTMTLHLRDRTEEAARLYAETLQRNKELKEINERLEATQLQLIQSEKLASIGQLTAGIVHDVKNPFAVIMGMSEVLAEDENLDEATRHGLKVIRESAVKGNTIVSDLLKFARQSKPEMRTMDLRETIQTSMRLTAYLTRRYNTVADLPENPLIATYDAQQVEQVLINMIHNAIQAMPNGGALQLSLKQIDETAQISIQDTGSGISPEHVKRIFDPFFTTKKEGEGTGLGLSVSYGIIANHRGKIEVESELGKGTKFTIILPITQPSVEPGETT